MHVQEVKEAVFAKETLRCSDIRKGMILMYKALCESNADEILTRVFETAVEISELLYAHWHKRTPTSILRLHNVCCAHGMLCIQLFGVPKTMTTRKFFGRYFHSLTTHTPLFYRMIALWSLNTEGQERICLSIIPIRDFNVY